MLRRLSPFISTIGKCDCRCFPNLNNHNFDRIVLPLYRKLHKMATLETLKFDNLALKSLPIDPVEENRVRPVSGACFSKGKPTPVKNPKLVAFSQSAMDLLDLPAPEMARPDVAEYFSGNKLLPGTTPAAHCYCGHQFGVFAGQLGDGAAMYLGEVLNNKGERWEIQLKGSGLTPFSRTADGRKVLRSTIREFLCSEAIHNLGIPTTRGGTCVTSDTKVVRDIFYNGNPIEEQCSIVLRIAPTFLRFGSFEIFKPTDPESGRKGPSVGKTEILHQMLEYTTKTFYNQIWEAHKGDKQEMYLEFFKEVVRRTARLVAEWQSVGWCHGVLNTDNMSIVGVTIDYGPYGFMDSFDPQFICNGSDDGGRYTYEKQPEICKWNCRKLAEAIQEAIPLSTTEPALELFDEEYAKHYKMKMRAKLGLQKEIPEDNELVSSLFETMESTGSDFTNTFRCLSRLSLPGCPSSDQDLKEVTDFILTQCFTLDELKKANAPKMDPRQLQMILMLSQTNPGLLPMLGRGYLSFTKELERLEKMEELKNLTIEEKSRQDREAWQTWLKKYVERLKFEVEDEAKALELNKKRVQIMNSTNPRFILRNYIAENAIKAAEKGDYSEVNRVLKLLENPYSEEIDLGDLTSPVGPTTSVDEKAGSSVDGDLEACSIKSYDDKPPSWALDLRVT